MDKQSMKRNTNAANTPDDDGDGSTASATAANERRTFSTNR